MCDVTTWLICIFKKHKYLRNEEIFENSESIFSFLLIQTFFLCFNMASIGKMGFLSQYHFIMMGPISVQKFAYFCLQDFKPVFFSRVKFVTLKKNCGSRMMFPGLEFMELKKAFNCVLLLK